MPTSVLAAGVATLASAGATYAFGTAAAWAAFSWTTTFFTGLVLSGLGRALAPRESSSQASGTTLNVRSPVAPRRIVYGQRRVGGTIVYLQNLDAAGHDTMLHLVLALTGHECEAIGDIWFNDQPVGTLDGNGFVQQAPWAQGETSSLTFTGTVPNSPYQIALPFSPTSIESVAVAGTDAVYTAATFTRSGATITFSSTDVGKSFQIQYTYVSNATKSFARILKHTGSTTQAADTALVAESNGRWTANHRLLGVAYLYARLEASNSVWTGGIPTVTAIVKGKRVYDPRTGNTAWTRNPALILADYLCDTRYGLSCNFASEIDLAALIAAANICDEQVPLATGGYEPRYTCDLVIETSQKPGDVIRTILTSMAGAAIYTGGKWRIQAGAYMTPTVTLTEADLRGPLRVQSRVSRRENFNAVKGTYIAAASNWQPTDFPAVKSATYLAEDNNVEVYKDVQLECTTSASMAQRIAKIELLRARQQITVALACKLTAYRVQAGDTVMLTLARMGWSAKPFEVISSKFSIDASGVLGVDLALREIASNVYDWSSSEEQTADAAPDTDLPSPWNVAAPVSPTLSESSRTDPTGAVRCDVVLAWSPSSSAFVGSYEAQVRLITSSVWVDAVVAGLTFTYPNAVKGATYVGRVRAINGLGVPSAWVAATPRRITGPALESGITLAGLGFTGDANATRNTVFRQTTAPTTGISTSDLWFNTSNQSIYCYTGTEWKLAGASSSSQLIDGAGWATTATWSGVSGTDKPANGATRNIVTYAASAPASPSNGDIWIDTSASPNLAKVYTLGSWHVASNYITGTTQLTDDANLGQTAVWSSVSGSGKPADSATKNTIYRQGSQPDAATTNDVWFDTSNSSVYYFDGSSWVLAGDVTSSNTAAAITDQGAFATLDQITASNAATYVESLALNTDLISDHAATEVVRVQFDAGSWPAGDYIDFTVATATWTNDTASTVTCAVTAQVGITTHFGAAHNPSYTYVFLQYSPIPWGDTYPMGIAGKCTSGVGYSPNLSLLQAVSLPSGETLTATIHLIRHNKVSSGWYEQVDWDAGVLRVEAIKK